MSDERISYLEMGKDLDIVKYEEITREQIIMDARVLSKKYQPRDFRLGTAGWEDAARQIREEMNNESIRHR